MELSAVKLGIIGTGNMGQAIIKGLLANDDRPEIYAYDAAKYSREQVQKRFSNNISVVTSNLELAAQVDIILLAIKPQVIVKALGKPGDVAIGLSTSGTSENVALALQYAKKAGLVTVGFLGNDGGRCKDQCDFPLTVRSSDTPRIQEIHLLLGHIFCEQVEREVCTRSC